MTEPVIVKWHAPTVVRPRGRVVWFTGLSGSGKSTIANRVDAMLHAENKPSFVLDGDNVRHSLNASPSLLRDEFGDEFANRFGLGFGKQDRMENIRRVAAVAEILCSAGITTLTAFVSPYRSDRELARRKIESMGKPGDFVEVFVDTPLATCEARDPKGLYRKARAGELKGMTGLDDPYEAPLQPEIHLRTPQMSIERCAEAVIDYLRSASRPS